MEENSDLRESLRDMQTELVNLLNRQNSAFPDETEVSTAVRSLRFMIYISDLILFSPVSSCAPVPVLKVLKLKAVDGIAARYPNVLAMKLFLYSY